MQAFSFLLLMGLASLGIWMALFLLLGWNNKLMIIQQANMRQLHETEGF